MFHPVTPACRYQPGYNIGFGLFGGFAPLLAEASLEWSPYGPGLLLSLAGFVTVVTIVGSVHLLEHGKVLGKNWFVKTSGHSAVNMSTKDNIGPGMET